jgi:crossover junction endodeoxyribonuclease RusA
MTGDLDNIVKLVLDALVRHVYRDDRQIERILVQRFDPDNMFTFTLPSPTQQAAVAAEKPVLYVHLSNDPFEELL